MKCNVIIPAAGKATRLRPLSEHTSKIMVRVNGKPCLDYILESLYRNHPTSSYDIVIVDGAFDDIRKYCEIKHPNIRFVKQKEMIGPVNAIQQAFNLFKEVEIPMLIWLGDTIVLEDQLPIGDNFLVTADVPTQAPWCIWDGSDYYNKPKTFVENGKALVGIYGFSSSHNAISAFMNARGQEISDGLENYEILIDTNFTNFKTSEWYDIGDLPTYYKTCGKLLDKKSRAFNTIAFNSDLGILTKKPNYHSVESMQTIKHEKAWYNNLTSNQSAFTPKIFPSESNIVMSYESGTLLSDLMLYENLSETTWEYIIDKLFNIIINHFHTECDDQEFLQKFHDNSWKMWVEKSNTRIKDWCTIPTRDYKRPIKVFTKEEIDKLIGIGQRIASRTYPVGCIHGDLHFGNIIYNQQNDTIKFVDPRGSYGSLITPSGDNIYDFAKLSHDIYHGYNAMVAGVSPNTIVKNIFLNKLYEYKLPVNDIIDGGLLLIASCIGLHYDDEQRQYRFYSYVSETLKD